MRKERFEKAYNVNLDNVDFTLSNNGLYEFSTKTYKGLYVIKENDDYRAIEERTNSVSQWTSDLKGLERGGN